MNNDSNNDNTNDNDYNNNNFITIITIIIDYTGWARGPAPVLLLYIIIAIINTNS